MNHCQGDGTRIAGKSLELKLVQYKICELHINEPELLQTITYRTIPIFGHIVRAGGLTVRLITGDYEGEMATRH